MNRSLSKLRSSNAKNIYCRDHWFHRYTARVTFLYIMTASIGFSLPEDRSKTMYLSAVTADLNQKTHLGVYKENVELDQGTTHVRATEAMTETDEKNQLIKAIVKGSANEQAHFWTQPAIDKPVMHAYANTMYYYPRKNLIELVGNAKVIQGNDSFSAPKISYDTLHEHVLSNGDKKRPTKIVINMENNQ